MPASLPDCLDNDLEVNLLILNYANVMLSRIANRHHLAATAVEAVADFSGSPRVALLLLDEDGERLEVASLFVDRQARRGGQAFFVAGTPFARLMGQRHDALLPLKLVVEAPMPADLGDEAEGSASGAEENPADDTADEQGRARCLCMPVAALSGTLLGFVTLAVDARLTMACRQYLRVLATTLAVGLENARLFEQAVVDDLTGLYIRRYHEIRVREELAKLGRHDGQMAMILLDVDRFKHINDIHGHPTGDIVLRELARLMAGQVRQGVDIVCRYGGEEFTILLPGQSAEAAALVAERIRGRCEHQRFAGAENLYVTVSAGVAAASSHEPLSAEELFERADSMLYRAKQAGRNAVRTWGHA